MRDDLTVIYYTSNREKPEFEAVIRQTLWDTIAPLGLPLISVSQEPIDFGQNICVGHHEASSQNAFRQLQIGAQAATTTFVALAESDSLYPVEYFQFRPAREDTGYLALPVYVLSAQRGKACCFFAKHRGTEGAMIVGRQCLVNGINKQLADVGTWGPHQSNGSTIRYLLHIIPPDYFPVSVPVVSIKTDQNMHRKTPLKRGSATEEIAGYGSAHALLRKYVVR